MSSTGDNLIDVQTEIPLHMLPSPSPRSADEIILCRYIEWLQGTRRAAYDCGAEQDARLLEFEITHLMIFLRER